MRYKALKSEWPWLWPFKSFKVKSNGAVGLSVYEFLLVSNSNHMSISHRFNKRRYIHLKIFSLFLIIGPKFCPTPYPPGPPLSQGNISENQITSSLGHREGSHQKWSWLVKYFLSYVVNRRTDTGRTDGHKKWAINPWRGLNYRSSSNPYSYAEHWARLLLSSNVGFYLSKTTNMINVCV